MKKLWNLKINFIKNNPILSSYISFVKGVVITLILLSLTSCKISYYQPTSRVEKVLGVTQEGDTIQVPIDYFEDRAQRQYDFNLEYFYWRNDWFLYNPNIYNRRWFVNNWWWNPYTHWSYPTYIYRPNNVWRPRNQPKRKEVQPRRRTPQVQPNRGRSNQQRTQVRQPNYVRPTTRGKVSTPTRTRTTPNVVRRSNNNTRTKNQ